MCYGSILNLQAAGKVRFERMNPPTFDHILKQSSAKLFNFEKSVFLPQCIYFLHMICRISTGYFPKYHSQAVGFLINCAIPMRDLHINPLAPELFF